MPSRRDANERALVGLWRSAGCVWIPQPRENGFDGVLISPRTGLHLVEIKNGERRWQLTDAERQRCLEVENLGVTYEIVESTEDALRLV